LADGIAVLQQKGSKSLIGAFERPSQHVPVEKYT
jgi:hypothetical protein